MPFKTDFSKLTIPVDSKIETIKPFIEHANLFVFGEAGIYRSVRSCGSSLKAIADNGGLINSGVNIVAASKCLGHTLINQALNTNTHLT